VFASIRFNSFRTISSELTKKTVQCLYLSLTASVLTIASFSAHAQGACETNGDLICTSAIVKKYVYQAGGAPGVYDTFDLAVAAIPHDGICGSEGPFFGPVEIQGTLYGVTTTYRQAASWKIFSGQGTEANPCNPSAFQWVGEYAGGTREIVCPPGFLYAPSSTLQQACYRPRAPKECKVGNPMYPIAGAKQEDVSIRGFMPIKLIYRSDRRKNPFTNAQGNVEPDGFEIAFGWSLDASVFRGLLFENIPNLYERAWWSTADGYGFEFKKVGAVWQSMDDLSANRSLTQLSATSWMLTNLEENYAEVADNGTGETIRYYADGRKYRFGKVVGTSNLFVDDRFGRRIEFMYEPTTVTGPNNEPPQIRLTKISTGSGLVTLVRADLGDPREYPASNALRALSKVIYQDGKSTSFVYGGAPSAQQLTQVLHDDENGVPQPYMTAAYNLEGRVISTEHTGGVDKWQVSDIGTNIVSPLGSSSGYALTQGIGGARRIQYSYQPAGAGCPATSTGYREYDARGNVTDFTNFNLQKTVMAYESSRSFETARIEGLDNAQTVAALSLTVLPAGSRKVSTQWHPDWGLKSRLAEPKRITTFVYNGQPDPTAANAVLSCIPAGTPLLPNNKPIAALCKKVEQATSDDTGIAAFTATSVGAARVWTYTYNADGQMLTANGPRTDATDVTTYEYYTATDTTTTPPKYVRGDIKKLTNAVGHVTETTNYNGNGQPTRILDPNGLITNVTYHPRGWLASVGVTNGTATLTTSYTYYANGRLKRVTQPDGSYLNYGYDPALRLTSLTDNLGNSVVYTLDNAGNRTKEETKDTGGVLKRQVARVYDALNRVQSVTGGTE
jgi:YD repeat-containing protein